MLPTRISISRGPRRLFAAASLALAILILLLPLDLDGGMASRVPVVIFLLVVAMLMYLMALGTTEVELDNQNLRVMRGRRRWTLPLKEVDRIELGGLGRQRSVTLHFRTPTPIGEKLAFQIWGGDTWLPWSPPNTLQMLRDGIRGAGGELKEDADD
ncbi:MAG: hypothetical protein ACREL4_02315 [Gemmatimonadales bacterium]